MSQLSMRARKHMIDGQLEPNQVLSESVLNAMASVAREDFVPEAYRGAAYLDEAIALGKGRYILPPTLIGQLLQAADIMPGHKLLLIGAGLGYSAALAGLIGAQVYAVEESTELANKARQTLAQYSQHQIHVLTQSHQGGDTAHAPFDRILIEGAVLDAPAILIDQLAEDGRLTYIQAGKGAQGMPMLPSMIKVLRRTDSGVTSDTHDRVMAPLLWQAMQKQMFQF